MSGIKTYSDTYSDGLAVFAAAHNGDGMSNDFSNKVINWLSVSGFPTLNVNLIPGTTISYVSEGNVGEQNAGLIRQAVEEYTAKDAKSAIAAVVRADKASNKVEVEAKIKIAEGAVTVWLPGCLKMAFMIILRKTISVWKVIFIHTIMYCVSQAHRLLSVISWVIHFRQVPLKTIHAVLHCHPKRWITAVWLSWLQLRKVACLL